MTNDFLKMVTKPLSFFKPGLTLIGFVSSELYNISFPAGCKSENNFVHLNFVLLWQALFSGPCIRYGKQKRFM